ncbi:putative transposase [Shigella sonnei]|nr:putative transposase [Shigella sonnei]
MSKKKNTTTPTPHDAAFRSFLANPDVARDFLELHLPAEYRQLCDLSTLKLEPATFVEPDLHQYASDILWSVKTTGGEDGAAWRHPVVRPDSDRQLLAHPPVSAEPAGAVSGCRYGPMSEKPGLQRPFRSRRPCRAGNGAPCTPDGV